MAWVSGVDSAKIKSQASTLIISFYLSDFILVFSFPLSYFRFDFCPNG